MNNGALMVDDAARKLSEARAAYSLERQRFDTVLSLAIRTCQGIRDAIPTNEAANVGIVLFDKAVMHAKSLGKVVPIVPGSIRQDHDLASAAVLVRAIAETFLAYWYACRQPKTPEDFEFRDALMSYHRLKRLAITSPLWKWTPDDTTLSELLQQARARLESSPIFRQQRPAAQRSQLDGKDFADLSLLEIAKSAEISEWFWTCAYKYLSQFNHATPLSVTELSRFDPAKVSGPQLLGLVLQFANAFLARFTFDIHNNYFRGVKTPSMGVNEVALLGSLMLVLSSSPSRP